MLTKRRVFPLMPCALRCRLLLLALQGHWCSSDHFVNQFSSLNWQKMVLCYLLWSFSACTVSWHSLLGHQPSSRASMRSREEGRLYQQDFRIALWGNHPLKQCYVTVRKVIVLATSELLFWSNTGVSGRNKRQNLHKNILGVFRVE